MKFDRKIQNTARKKMKKVVDEIVDRQATFKQTTFKQKTFKRKTFKLIMFAFLKLCLINCQNLLFETLNRVRKTSIEFII